LDLSFEAKERPAGGLVRSKPGVRCRPCSPSRPLRLSALCQLRPLQSSLRAEAIAPPTRPA
jgi:hypothetical protein